MGVVDSGYQKAGAVSGPARVLYAPVTVAVPAGIHDIIEMVQNPADSGIYPPKTGWVDFGLAAGASSISRDFDTEGQEYEQPTGLLFEKVSEINRSISVNMAEIVPENLRIIENSPAHTTVAAAANQSAQKVLKAGSFSDRTSYRIAIIEQRDRDAVEVEEPDGHKRGGLVAHVGLRSRIAADEAEIEVAKNDPTNIDVEFTLFPEPNEAIGQEYVHHYFEDAGVIAAV